MFCHNLVKTKVPSLGTYHRLNEGKWVRFIDGFFTMGYAEIHDEQVGCNK